MTSHITSGDTVSFTSTGGGMLVASSEVIPESFETYSHLRVTNKLKSAHLGSFCLRTCTSEVDINKGLPITVGCIVQISCAVTGYLFHTAMSEVTSDNGIYLSVAAVGTLSHKWSVHSRYRIRGVGDPLWDGDHVYFVNVLHPNIVLSTSTLYENNDRNGDAILKSSSLDDAQAQPGWKIKKQYVISKSVDEIEPYQFVRIIQPQANNVPQLVCMLDDDEILCSHAAPLGKITRLLASPDKQHRLCMAQKPFQGHGEYSCEGVWQICPANQDAIATGGAPWPCFHLRNVLTDCFLSLTEQSGSGASSWYADISSEACEMSLFCMKTIDSAGRDTLLYEQFGYMQHCLSGSVIRFNNHDNSSSPRKQLNSWWEYQDQIQIQVTDPMMEASALLNEQLIYETCLCKIVPVSRPEICDILYLKRFSPILNAATRVLQVTPNISQLHFGLFRHLLSSLSTLNDWVTGRCHHDAMLSHAADISLATDLSSSSNDGSDMAAITLDSIDVSASPGRAIFSSSKRSSPCDRDAILRTLRSSAVMLWKSDNWYDSSQHTWLQSSCCNLEEVVAESIETLASISVYRQGMLLHSRLLDQCMQFANVAFIFFRAMDSDLRERDLTSQVVQRCASCIQKLLDCAMFQNSHIAYRFLSIRIVFTSMIQQTIAGFWKPPIENLLVCAGKFILCEGMHSSQDMVSHALTDVNIQFMIQKMRDTHQNTTDLAIVNTMKLLSILCAPGMIPNRKFQDIIASCLVPVAFANNRITSSAFLCRANALIMIQKGSTACGWEVSPYSSQFNDVFPADFVTGGLEADMDDIQLKEVAVVAHFFRTYCGQSSLSFHGAISLLLDLGVCGSNFWTELNSICGFGLNNFVEWWFHTFQKLAPCRQCFQVAPSTKSINKALKILDRTILGYLSDNSSNFKIDEQSRVCFTAENFKDCAPNEYQYAELINSVVPGLSMPSFQIQNTAENAPIFTTRVISRINQSFLKKNWLDLTSALISQKVNEFDQEWLKCSLKLFSELCRGRNLKFQKIMAQILPPECLLQVMTDMLTIHGTNLCETKSLLLNLLMRAYLESDFVFSCSMTVKYPVCGMINTRPRHQDANDDEFGNPFNSMTICSAEASSKLLTNQLCYFVAVEALSTQFFSTDESEISYYVDILASLRLLISLGFYYAVNDAVHAKDSFEARLFNSFIQGYQSIVKRKGEVSCSSKASLLIEELLLVLNVLLDFDELLYIEAMVVRGSSVRVLHDMTRTVTDMLMLALEQPYAHVHKSVLQILVRRSNIHSNAIDFVNTLILQPEENDAVADRQMFVSQDIVTKILRECADENVFDEQSVDSLILCFRKMNSLISHGVKSKSQSSNLPGCLPGLFECLRGGAIEKIRRIDSTARYLNFDDLKNDCEQRPTFSQSRFSYHVPQLSDNFVVMLVDVVSRIVIPRNTFDMKITQWDRLYSHEKLLVDEIFNFLGMSIRNRSCSCDVILRKTWGLVEILLQYLENSSSAVTLLTACARHADLSVTLINKILSITNGLIADYYSNPSEYLIWIRELFQFYWVVFNSEFTGARQAVLQHFGVHSYRFERLWVMTTTTMNSVDCNEQELQLVLLRFLASYCHQCHGRLLIDSIYSQTVCTKILVSSTSWLSYHAYVNQICIDLFHNELVSLDCLLNNCRRVDCYLMESDNNMDWAGTASVYLTEGMLRVLWTLLLATGRCDNVIIQKALAQYWVNEEVNIDVLTRINSSNIELMPVISYDVDKPYNPGPIFYYCVVQLMHVSIAHWAKLAPKFPFRGNEEVAENTHLFLCFGAIYYLQFIKPSADISEDQLLHFKTSLTQCLKDLLKIVKHRQALQFTRRSNADLAVTALNDAILNIQNVMPAYGDSNYLDIEEAKLNKQIDFGADDSCSPLYDTLLIAASSCGQSNHIDSSKVFSTAHSSISNVFNYLADVNCDWKTKSRVLSTMAYQLRDHIDAARQTEQLDAKSKAQFIKEELSRLRNLQNIHVELGAWHFVISVLGQMKVASSQCFAAKLSDEHKFQFEVLNYGGCLLRWRNASSQDQFLVSLRRLELSRTSSSSMMAISQQLRLFQQDLVTLNMRSSLIPHECLTPIAWIFNFFGSLCKANSSTCDYLKQDLVKLHDINIPWQLMNILRLMLYQAQSLMNYIADSRFNNFLAPFICKSKNNDKRRLVSWHDPRNNFTVLASLFDCIFIAIEAIMNVGVPDNNDLVLECLDLIVESVEYIGAMSLVCSSEITTGATLLGKTRQVVWNCENPAKFYSKYTREMTKQGVTAYDKDFALALAAMKSWSNLDSKYIVEKLSNITSMNPFPDVIKESHILGVRLGTLRMSADHLEHMCLRFISTLSESCSDNAKLLTVCTRLDDGVLFQNMENLNRRALTAVGADKEVLSGSAVMCSALLSRKATVIVATKNLLTAISKRPSGLVSTQLLASVEIMKDNAVQKLYFPVPHFVTLYWSYEEVHKIRYSTVYTVNRSSPEEKICDFVHRIDAIIAVMKRQESIDHLCTPFVHKLLGGGPQDSWQNLLIPSYTAAFLVLTVVLNIYFSYSVSNPTLEQFSYYSSHLGKFYVWKYKNAVVQVVQLVQVSLAVAMALTRFLNSTAGEGFTSGRSSISMSGGMTSSARTLLDASTNFLKTSRFANFGVGVRVWVAELWWPIALVVFCVMGYYKKVWFYPLCLFDIILQVRFMKFLVEAVRRNVIPIVYTLLLTLVILYLFAIVASFTFPNQYTLGSHGGCDNPLSCFKLHLDYGLNAAPDWSGDSYIESTVNAFGSSKLGQMAARFAGTGFTLLYIILVNLVLQAIITGLITDTFSTMRQESEFIESDIASNCFICSIEKEKFENAGVSYQRHTEEEHNMWKYVWFKIYLEFKDPLSYSTLEEYAVEQMKEKLTFVQLFPIKRSMTIEQCRGYND